MKNSKCIFGGLFLLVVVFSFFVPYYFFPSDILNYFPSYTTNSWQKPHNSLLADPLFQFEPWRVFAKESLVNGKLPLWNPYNALGQPFLANPQTALFFPLSFIYYLLPVGPALLLMHLLKLFFLCLFSYLYLRTIKIVSPIAFLGAGAITFSGFSMTWLLWPQTNVFLFLPLFLTITEKLLQGRNVSRWLFICSVSYACALFGGHPETLFHITVVHILYSVFRLFNHRRVISKLLLFIFIGYLLASIQLIPFLEYLLSSYSFQNRNEAIGWAFLPFSSIPLLLIPFSLGAPHMYFYKSISSLTNFQEMIGGYIGPILLLLAFFGVFRLRKNPLVRFWAIIATFCFGISYAIPPFSLFSLLPVFNKAANHRLVGIFGFALVIVGCLSLQEIMRKGKMREGYAKILVFVLSLSTISVILVGPLGAFFSLPPGFFNFIQYHLMLLIFSTLGFFLFLFLFPKRGFIILFLLFFLQTGLLFFFYTPFTLKKDYYPKPNFIEKLRSIPQGTILDVGNPALKEESNIVYSLPHAQGYDALGIAEYTKEFNRAFPQKNHWGKVEGVNPASLQAFGITYVLADHDIRLPSEKIQKEHDVLHPLLQNTPHIEFQATKEKLREIRVLTANHNRLNTCSFVISLFKQGTIIDQAKEDCKNVRDAMFYTVSFSADLAVGDTYVLTFGLENATPTNAISLWGNGKGDPYVELLFDEGQVSKYTLLDAWKNLFLFEISGSTPITFAGTYKILEYEAEFVSLKTSAKQKETMVIRIPNYPGWQVLLDGVSLQKDGGTFITFSVPEGQHVVTLSYKPLSFLVGSSISFLTAFCMILLFLRHLVQGRKNKLVQLFTVFAKRASVLALRDHYMLFLSSMIVGVILSLIVVRAFPYNGVMVKTTAINWFTVHSYPKEQDSYYFVVVFLTTILTSFTTWAIMVWRKK